ncbi:ATP-binding protein [Flavobacterium sp.]|uniref:tetratricopeptide repeat-containing sensor histidine kinase n=1 Tax=Flavobacterium sp. TaxID=239 RepID=UPI0037BE7515
MLNQNNDSINRNLLFKVVDKYYSINKNEKFLNLTNKLLALSIEKNDTIHIAKSFYYTGNYHDDESQFESAFSYYIKSEKLYQAINDTLMMGTLAVLKGGIFFDSGNFAESETEAIKALRLLSKTKNTNLVYNCYNLIGISLKELNNYKKSLYYFALALKQLDLLEKENYPKEKIGKSRIACYNNIGRVYQKMEDYPKAINYYNKALQTKNIKQDFPKSYALLLNNLGYSKMKAGDYEAVEELFLESMRIRDSLGLELAVATNKIDLGEYYLIQKDTAKGFAYLKEGYLLSKKLNSSPYLIQSLKLLMDSDSKNKLYYTNQYLKIKDSVQQLERATRNKFARIAYETDQVEEKNEILSKTITNIGMGSGVVILILGGFFIIYRLKSRNRELLFVKEQQEANEKIYQLMLHQQLETEQARNEERNRIAMELHDGIINSIFTTRFSLMQLESEAVDKKQELVQELKKAEREIRRVSHNLKQNLLTEDKALPEILANLIESQQNEFGTKFDLSVDKFIDWSLVSSDSKIHVYRIIQEALQNSNKYSKAKRCCVFLMKTGDKITIRIWDNGIGFNPEKAKQGIGLKNIKERTKVLKGVLKITSTSEKGTTIEIIF